MENEKSILMQDNAQINLSDFALFLAVMKYKDAYRDVLSIILDEPDIEMDDVKVEEVMLNAKGRRAIRLDAWGRSSDRRQFNVEMQNDTENDDVTKRSRFYQGLIDTPVLKAGKHTKYRQLPPTVIIFITQDDIFRRGLAMYTFEETCVELPDLRLGDGTKKLFLNMTVMSGRPELVSLLQYMKNTTINNPDIIVHDERIAELDRIVAEVKTTEEWEDVHMSILSRGIERGQAIGMERGQAIGMERGQAIGEKRKLIDQVCRKLSKGKAPDEIAEELDEDREHIDTICSVAEKYAPDYNRDAIYSELSKKTEMSEV